MRLGFASLALWVAACAAPAPAPRLTSSAVAPAPAPAPPPPAPSVDSVVPAPSAAAEPRACGEQGCLAFPSPEAAFSYVLQSAPRVLAVGEAHAQQGIRGVRSSTRRFAEQLLPMLSGKSKHLVIELLVANCQAKTVSGVAKTQAPVTENQAKGNQSEFVTLGKVAQRLGIEPQALAPSCKDYDAVVAAGDDALSQLLTLIAEETRKSIEALLLRPESSGQIVVTYGGALHNDLVPRSGQEAWSFGPALRDASGGKYVELDLIVPEFVKDSEAWRKLPWFAAFDREHLSDETLLYRPSPGSFALIFPKTDAAPQ